MNSKVTNVTIGLFIAIAAVACGRAPSGNNSAASTSQTTTAAQATSPDQVGGVVVTGETDAKYSYCVAATMDNNGDGGYWGIEASAVPGGSHGDMYTNVGGVYSNFGVTFHAGVGPLTTVQNGIIANGNSISQFSIRCR